MKNEGIDYINSKASFVDANTVEFQYSGLAASEEKGKFTLKGKNFLIAAGGRPRMYDHIAPEHYITSDDLFSVKKDPGTTLVIGGGYIAIECSGFLAGLGKKVHLLNRSETYLRTMDQDMAVKIIDQLQEEGVRSHTNAVV
jgi:thioredoxin reductase (NADPH)